MSNELRKIGAIIVSRVRTAGSKIEVCSAWEPEVNGEIEHSKILNHEGTRYGQIGTKYPPAELEALYEPNERTHKAAIKAWFQSDSFRAVAYILGAFPEITERMYSINDGMIVVKGEPV